jgi:hypothetical protein
MRANTHVSSSVTDVVDILDVNYDDLFCDYNTLTTVNSVTRVATGKYCAVALLRIVEMVALHEQNL